MRCRSGPGADGTKAPEQLRLEAVVRSRLGFNTGYSYNILSWLGWLMSRYREPLARSNSRTCFDNLYRSIGLLYLLVRSDAQLFSHVLTRL